MKSDWGLFKVTENGAVRWIIYTTFYWSAVNMALSCTVFCYLTLNKIMTLKSKLEVTHTIRKHWYGFLFAFHSIYGSILHHFRDRARYW